MSAASRLYPAVVILLGLLLHSLGSADPHPFSVQDMIKFRRISSPVVSPDGKLVIFSVRDWDATAHKAAYNLWMMKSDGSGAAALTTDPVGVGNDNVLWAPNSKSILYTSTRSGQQAIYSRVVASGYEEKISNFALDVDFLRWSFNSPSTLLFVAEVYPSLSMDETAAKDAQIASSGVKGYAFDQLYIRHWDTLFVGKWRHVFSISITPSADIYHLVGDPIDLMFGISGDSPLKPFGDVSHFDISPASAPSAEVAYTTQLGRDAAWTTDYNIFVIPAVGGTPKCITCDNLGKDMQPAYSPDGRYIAFIRLVKPVSESDRARLMLYDRTAMSTRELSVGWDNSVSWIRWSSDSSQIYFGMEEVARERIFTYNLASGQRQTLLADGSNSDLGFTDAGKLIFVRSTLVYPAEIFTADADGSNAKALTALNKPVLDDIVGIATPEEVAFPGAYGDLIQSWVFKPYNFDPLKKYPVVLLVHGGPEGAWTDTFGYRWNPQAYVGAGFAVVMINFHGSTGFGQKFVDSIHQHWGDAPWQDIMMGMNYMVKKYSYMDSTRIGALGASYGGFMINWLLGHNTDNLFKVFVCHDGIFDQVGMYYSTEELFFPEDEMGGLPFVDQTLYDKWNPMKFVSSWTTPTLVVQGGKDFRIPESQGISTFTALQRRGIPSKFLYFPNENHWVLNSDNSVLWHNTVIAWVKQWLKA